MTIYFITYHVDIKTNVKITMKQFLKPRDSRKQWRLKMESLANRKGFKNRWLKTTEKTHSSKKKGALEKGNVIQHQLLLQRKTECTNLILFKFP